MLKKLKTNKRQKFLEIYFKTLGADQILWLYQDEACIAGTVVYDPTNPDERQDFIWYTPEDKTPDKAVEILLTHLKQYELLHLDKLKLPLADIVIAGMTEHLKIHAFNELYKVKINLIEDGKESGYYQIHE